MIIFLDFFFFFFFFFDLGFTALSRIFRADRSSKMGEIRRTREKKHLTIRKQNFAFPHVTHGEARTTEVRNLMDKSQLSYPLGYRGPQGDQGNNVIYFRGTEAHKSKTEGNRGTNRILGSREHRKLRF